MEHFFGGYMCVPSYLHPSAQNTPEMSTWNKANFFFLGRVVVSGRNCIGKGKTRNVNMEQRQKMSEICASSLRACRKTWTLALANPGTAVWNINRVIVSQILKRKRLEFWVLIGLSIAFLGRRVPLVACHLSNRHVECWTRTCLFVSRIF